jgi:hypothetical protein
MTDISTTAAPAEQSSIIETPSAAPASQETARHDAMENTSNSLDSSIDNAIDKVFGNDTEKVPSALSSRDERGRFSPKSEDAAPVAKVEPVTTAPIAEAQPVTPIVDVPARFSPDAKAAWAAVPEAVKGEVNRAFSEMEKGLNEYKDRYAPLKPFEDMASQYGTTIETALNNYVTMETALEQNPVQGFTKICEFLGKTPQQFIAEITGQQQQAPSQQESTILQLQQQVQQLTQQLSGVSTSIQSRQDAEIEQQITAWASDKPRFNELRDSMGQLARAGMVDDLDEAYAMAERIKPATVQAQAALQPKPDLKAQTQKGSLSTTGAPVSGSNPAFRKPASSAAEAVERSFAQLGIG